ncbi:Mitochondrial inner membrane protein OXA1-like [Platanthera zijinensis]|uniref:Mitochondrial inner membrane protein OXA1-like n=1 Tax=Platanthera zijinensis TaxID=2320716 RepID=A0AAP0BPE6_9ASPA
MACSRKALASGYNSLSRKFHPSFLHILQDNRDRSESPEPTAPASSSSIQRAYSVSKPLDKFRPPTRDWRRIGLLSLPLGVDRSSRSYSSGTDVSNEISYINDAAEVLTDTGVGSVIAAASSIPSPFPGEVAAAAADSFLPVAALQHLIDGVHSFTGLNWWASIALTTVLIRGATVPLLVNQLKATMKLNTMRPELEKLKEAINNNMNPDTLQENQKRMKDLFKKHGVTPFTPLKGALIQGPVFISFFAGISNMVEKVPSFRGGGAYWFTDLTTPDTMYILPVLTATAFLVTIELNMQEGLEGNPTAKTMKNFFRVLGLVTIPFTANFPKMKNQNYQNKLLHHFLWEGHSGAIHPGFLHVKHTIFLGVLSYFDLEAIFCYWLTSNLFSLAYGFAIKRPPVRKFLDLPAVIQQPNSSPLPDFPFFGGPKPALPAPSSIPEKGSGEFKSPGRNISSTVISQRIRNLEKTVKARNRSKKR